MKMVKDEEITGVKCKEIVTFLKTSVFIRQIKEERTYK